MIFSVKNLTNVIKCFPNFFFIFLKKKQELDDEEEEMEEDSSEGESEPPESDEDTYVKSDKRKLKRVKCSFLDDEAEDEDDIANGNSYFKINFG